jgi:hypothetical protein
MAVATTPPRTAATTIMPARRSALGASIRDSTPVMVPARISGNTEDGSAGPSDPRRHDVARQRASLPPAIAADVEATIAEWCESGRVARLWALDPTVWTAGDEASWLGWLRVADDQLAHPGRLDAIAADVRAGRLRPRAPPRHERLEPVPRATPRRSAGTTRSPATSPRTSTAPAPATTSRCSRTCR